MQFLSRVCKTNSYLEKSDYFAFSISPAYARLLLERRSAAIDFLNRHADRYDLHLAQVRLAWNSELVAFDWAGDEDAGTVSELSALFTLAEEDCTIVVLPEAFKPVPADCSRLGGEKIIFSADGAMRLCAYNHYTGDYLESELFNEELLREVIANERAVSTPIAVPQTQP